MRRSVERALSDLHETDDGTDLGGVRIITETEAGELVDLKTGEPVESGRSEVIATIGTPPSET